MEPKLLRESSLTVRAIQLSHRLHATSKAPTANVTRKECCGQSYTSKSI